MFRWIAIFLFLGYITAYTQNRNYITRNRKPLVSIGSIYIGSYLESFNFKSEDSVYRDFSEVAIEIYKIDRYTFNKTIELKNLYLKFYECKLVEISFDFNQEYSDYIGYLQGTQYLERKNGETVIMYNTFTPGIIMESFLNGDTGDSTTMFIENYQE